MLEAVFVPWALFVGLAWILSFSVHFEHTWAAWALVAAGLVFPLGLWYVVKHQSEDPRSLSHLEPNWFFFLAAVCSIAWFAGLGFGLYNWFSTMAPYYDKASLALISNVSTRSSKGGQFIDIAALEFTPFTEDGHSYCVAPIVTPGPPGVAPPAFYEFWAVGMDCCNPFEPKVFMCGEPNDDEARGGVRWTDPSQMPQFRKAIQQAQEETEYQIKAGEDVLFLQWTGDPMKKIHEQFLTGRANFRFAVWAYLGLSVLFMLLEVAHQKFA
eukprot:g2039.t1